MIDCVIISRGMAPAKSLCAIFDLCQMLDCPCDLVDGLPLVEAKNAAVDMMLARPYKPDHVLLVEDDVIPDDAVWSTIQTMQRHEAGYARARGRDGKDNVVYAADGTFLSTGNCFTVIPLWCLEALDPPVFEECVPFFLDDYSDFRFSMMANHGHGSDTLFWYKLRHLPNPPTIVELGRCAHIRHPLNEHQDHCHPLLLGEW